MRLPAFFLLVASAIAQPPPITINQTQVQGGTPGQFLKVNPNRTLGQGAGGGGGGASPAGCPGAGSIQLYATSTTFGCDSLFQWNATTHAGHAGVGSGTLDPYVQSWFGTAVWEVISNDTATYGASIAGYQQGDHAIGIGGLAVTLVNGDGVNAICYAGAADANCTGNYIAFGNLTGGNQNLWGQYINSADLQGGVPAKIVGLEIADQAGGTLNWALKTNAGLVEIGGPLAISTGTPIGSAAAAVCWKTTTTLSYCTSVVGAGGTCTCH